MPRFARRTLTAILLAAVLALAPAAPLLAAPFEASPASWLGWLADWLVGKAPADADRIKASSEIHPTMDPDGADSNTAGPDASTASTTPDSESEIYPTMDPNG